MSKGPSFKFYFRDFYGKAAHLDRSSRSSYLNLICSYHEHKSPITEASAQIISKADSAEWPELREKLAAFFKVIDGLWIDPDLDRKFAKQRKAAKKRRAGRAVREKPYKKFGRVVGARWESLRQAVFNRDGYRCVYCEDLSSDLHCDHIVPLSRGGDNSIGNLATSCASCNLSKNDKLVSEWKGANS